MIKTIALALAAVVSLGSAAAAQETATIRYGDLDLATARGQAILDNRIANGAGQACVAEGAGPAAQAAINACERGFQAEARRALDAATSGAIVLTTREPDQREG